jgi:hypothetical protein
MYIFPVLSICLNECPSWISVQAFVKYLYQAGRVRVKVCLIFRFSHWNLELFWRYVIFCWQTLAQYVASSTFRHERDAGYIMPNNSYHSSDFVLQKNKRLPIWNKISITFFKNHGIRTYSTDVVFCLFFFLLFVLFCFELWMLQLVVWIYHLGLVSDYFIFVDNRMSLLHTRRL